MENLENKIIGRLDGKAIITPDGRKRFPFVMTAEVIDRQNEIMDLETINWINFDKNSVARYEHNSEIDPIGKWFDRKETNNKVYGNFEANKLPDSKTGKNISANIEELIEDDQLIGCSIGFPRTYTSTELQLLDNNTVIKPNGKIIEIEQTRADKVRKSYSKTITLLQGVEPVECSICAIPACQESLKLKSLNDSIKEKIMDFKSIDIKSPDFKSFIETNRGTIEELLDVKKGAAISKDNLKKVDDCIKACKAIDEHVATHADNMKSCKADIIKSLKALKPKPAADDTDEDGKDEDMQGNSIDYDLMTKSFEKALKPLFSKIEELSKSNIANEDDINKIMEGK